jgi:hypothetical protein
MAGPAACERPGECRGGVSSSLCKLPCLLLSTHNCDHPAALEPAPRRWTGGASQPAALWRNVAWPALAGQLLQRSNLACRNVRTSRIFGLHSLP